jgi:hypothetical protein
LSKFQTPAGADLTTRRKEEFERIQGTLGKCTGKLFGLLSVAEERADLDMMGRTIDRLVEVSRVRAWVLDAFLPEQISSPNPDGAATAPASGGSLAEATESSATNGQAEGTATEGGGGS